MLLAFICAQAASKTGGVLSVDDLSDAIASTLKGTKDENGKPIPAKTIRSIADDVRNLRR